MGSKALQNQKPTMRLTKHGRAALAAVGVTDTSTARLATDPTTLVIKWDFDAPEEVDFASWASDNDYSPEMVEEVRALKVGACASFGGGGAPRVTITVLS